jgi:hypothetical protein
MKNYKSTFERLLPYFIQAFIAQCVISGKWLNMAAFENLAVFVIFIMSALGFCALTIEPAKMFDEDKAAVNWLNSLKGLNVLILVGAGWWFCVAIYATAFFSLEIKRAIFIKGLKGGEIVKL